ncbi:cation:dicarboxylate symporter family transporter [Cellulosilyticum ruminicola]|uniref:cation:dicarboxylate symporter family transporter n=1 Tax=Cellulosilyticum ruminicola TaxID=425254 RepID=UPI0006D28B6E|nr:cation:dicarboxylase symporter family transporter [Cellulosilyticum ruminicola]
MGQSTFLIDFLLLSNIRTVIFIAVLLGLFVIIHMMEKRKVKFSIRMISGTVIGLILGISIQFIAGFPKVPGDVQWLREVSSWYGLVGNGFMDLLKMLVVPLVFLSITRIIMNMQGENLGKLTAKSIGMLLGTTLIAAFIGMVIGNFVDFSTDMQITNNDAQIREITSIVDTFRGLLPANPVKAMVDANVVAIVIFASFIGIAIRRMSKKHGETIEPFVKWIEAFYKIILSVAMTVIKFMPYAVIALLANTITARGIVALIAVIKFIVAIYVALIIMFIVHLVIAMLNGINPITYVKAVTEPLVLAFTSRSSLGTLPVTIETLHRKVGVEEGIASFVGSLGANMGMNGCAGIYPALVTIMLAQMTGTHMDLSFYIMLAIIITVASLGIAGLPGTATIAVSVVISGMGMGALFPLIGGVIAIDPIIDMGRTMLNVSGTLISATTVANTSGKLDRSVFNSQK